MDIISSQEFNAIVKEATIIKYGRSLSHPKVLENKNTIIKLFYRKRRLLSSDRVKPQALRFYRNTLSLNANGYNVPHVFKIQYCVEQRIFLIYYHKIEGQDIRSLASQGHLNIIQDVAKLIANLHQQGIFFRSIHLENLLYKSNGTIALIDISDLKIQSKSLSIYQRYRNLKHLLKVPHDKDVWDAYGITNFLHLYFNLAALSYFSRRLLSYFIKRAISINA